MPRTSYKPTISIMFDPVKQSGGRPLSNEGRMIGDDFDVVFITCETEAERTVYVRHGKWFLTDPGLENTSGVVFRVADTCPTYDSPAP